MVATIVETILRVIIYGMSVGGAFALVAIGFSLIFGVARLLNLAQGSFFLLGGYLTWIFVDRVFDFASPQVELVFSAIIAMVIMFLIGVASYMMVYPLEASFLGGLMVIVAEGTFIVYAINFLFGSVVRSLPFAAGNEMVTILGVEVHIQYFVILGFSVAALLSLLIFLSKTKFGKAIRAVAQDREAARLNGVNTTKVNAVVYGISAVLATLAAALTCSIPFPLEPLVLPGTFLGIAAIVVVLGGLGSLSGTVLASFIFAYIPMTLEEINPSWFPGLGAYITGIAAPLIILFVLLIRPTGLRGRPLKELLRE